MLGEEVKCRWGAGGKSRAFFPFGPVPSISHDLRWFSLDVQPHFARDTSKKAFFLPSAPRVDHLGLGFNSYHPHGKPRYCYSESDPNRVVSELCQRLVGKATRAFGTWQVQYTYYLLPFQCKHIHCLHHRH